MIGCTQNKKYEYNVYLQRVSFNRYNIVRYNVVSNLIYYVVQYSTAYFCRLASEISHQARTL